MARLFGCFEHIAKRALPHADYMLPCPLYHSTSSKVLWQRQGLVEKPSPNSLNTDFFNLKHVELD